MWDLISYMSFQIYKPNKANSGCAFNFYVMNDIRKEEPMLFIGAIKQFSWDAKKRTGSFEKNKKVPEKNILVKFSEFEAGEIISCFESRYEWSSVHSFEDNKTQISFSPWDKPKKIFDRATKKEKTITIPAFGINFTRNGSDMFRIPLEPGEVQRIISLLKDFLRRLNHVRFTKNSKKS